MRQIKAACGRPREKDRRQAPEKQLSHYAESLKLPVARAPEFVRRVCRSARKLVRSVVARIDLSQFPGSCCG
ncbi:hypothetical protein [Bradyrhizobium sp.]|uniref:hypothetical protein n=1 Tax=Bradyrhizobium sp. TaxID=376 RepID=UPI0023934B11|nr:hypothetical protein [Bradyrhizobium sp.]MDE2377373.1 hypothetical protein [Bradyrhizobium sp.]